MKKTALIIIISLIGICSKSFAQKLEENNKDEFTGKTVKHTSWEKLTSTMTANVHFRVSKNGDFQTLDIKMMIGKVFAIDRDQELMLKLDNGEVIKLQNTEFKVTCMGCGAVGLVGSEAEGIQVYYPVTDDQLAKLKANKVVKVRFTLQEGYFDEDVKDKNAEKIKASFNLI